ncbi:prepilin-type N-terminal cleavage/methylation domain-containing protein [Enterobacillus tribolii]|uniref:Type II secretion prepilin peptidase-dependent protein C n=1 Tax=Enterobacillus tribolii TaxID=1487935 RepID=A0A370QPS8_9GAMM|nr:prepilin-type N-terminal cleavage/methylation domain-containing protein [Enterobacillus tribolii]MBW7981420.1 hypothetical protein [Enterobacillus tribolii]RDK90796.1 type II secretion prepilin peptidase-dependent protein C [Enterobacillus tribolii]
MPIIKQQQGIALIEVMLAVFLAAAGIAGCLQYQQWIARGQLRQQQELTLWRSASQLLDAASGGIAGETAVRLLALPPQWQSRSFRQPAERGCERLTAEVTAPLNLKARMERIVCPP